MKTKENNFKELTEAKQRGAEIIIEDAGFFARNTLVANNSDYLIAFTFGRGSIPSSRGTLDTWKKFNGVKKIHITLLNK